MGFKAIFKTHPVSRKVKIALEDAGIQRTKDRNSEYCGPTGCFLSFGAVYFIAEK